MCARTQTRQVSAALALYLTRFEINSSRNQTLDRSYITSLDGFHQLCPSHVSPLKCGRRGQQSEMRVGWGIEADGDRNTLWRS